MWIEEFKEEYIAEIKARVLPIIKKFNPEIDEEVLKDNIWVDIEECDEDIDDCNGYEGKVTVGSPYMPFMTKEIYDAVIDVLDVYGALRFTWFANPTYPECGSIVELEVLFK